MLEAAFFVRSQKLAQELTEELRERHFEICADGPTASRRDQTPIESTYLLLNYAFDCLVVNQCVGRQSETGGGKNEH